jgi:hypothetical protein
LILGPVIGGGKYNPRRMGIDIHIGEHYFSISAPVFLLMAAVLLYVVIKVAGYLLAATGIW